MTDDEIEKLCAEATPGPWELTLNRETVLDAAGMWVADIGEDPDSAAFIAAARTLVPELLEHGRLR